jgi:trimeric autotransporter adhesin
VLLGSNVSNNKVQGNLIGLGADGSTALGNTGAGVYVYNGGSGSLVTGNVIGTDADGSNDAGERNVISGNINGVVLTDPQVTGNTVAGNFIGTDATGLLARGNTFDGVRIEAGATNNTIGGTLTVQRNVIAGNGQDGVQIDGEDSDGNTVRGNWIGVNAAGTGTLGNGGDGVYISSGADNSTIGGTGANDGNWIAGNAVVGVEVDGASTGTLIQGNRIGTNADGTLNWGHGQNGILLENGASNTRVGGATAAAGNIIAFSGQGGVWDDGISVTGNTSTGNVFLRNSIYGSVGLGIELGTDGVTPNDTGDVDTGPNGLLNTLVLNSARINGGLLSLNGSYTGAANTYYRLDFYSNTTSEPSGTGEGRTWLGSVNMPIGASGTLTGSYDLTATVAPGSYITATATRTDAAYTGFFETSEFSNHVVAVAPGITVTPISNSTEGLADGRFSVVLDAAPTANVSIALSVDDASELSLAVSSLIFTTANWNVPQEVVVTGVDDTFVDGTVWSNVILAAAVSADASYNGINPADVSIANADNDIVNLIVVDTTADTNDTGLGSSFTVSQLMGSKGTDGRVSLREALIAANNTANGTSADRITFGIAGTGTQVITLGSLLPEISQSVVIDGTTQTGWAVGSFLPIVIDANNAGSALTLAAGSDGSEIRGLVIRDAAVGIFLDSDNHLIAGNWIGQFNSDGTDAGVGEAITGSGITNEFDANGVTIGGTTVADRNVIVTEGSGSQGIYVVSADNWTVAGNYFGTDTTGNARLASTTNAGAGFLTTNGSVGNTIGGATDAHRNIFAGLRYGVYLDDSTSSANYIYKNWFGLGADGSTVLGNADSGIWLSGADFVQVGGVGLGNVVVGSGGAGITLDWGNHNTVVRGNFIGQNADGSVVAGNAGSGILIDLQTVGSTIGGAGAGEGNVITGSGGDGITVINSNGVSLSLLGNRIFGNAGLGIDLDNNGVTANDVGDADTGASNLQNFPVLASANSSGGNTAIVGTINSNAGATLRIEFFSSPTGDATGYGEGQVYLGATSVTADGSGNASFATLLNGISVTAGHVVSATATVDLGGGNYGSTSEFAANVVATNVAPGVTVGAVSGNTTEAGGTATFTVVLNTAPTANVTIALSSSDLTEGTVTPTSLVFTPLNWNLPQTVTVTGVDDLLDDGDISYTAITTVSAPGGSNYAGVTASDRTVLNTDNDSFNTIVVDTTSDVADGTTTSLAALMANKGADGFISLREAITAANNTANGSGGADRIHFGIAGTGPHTITPLSALPSITDAVVIDASTDDSFAANGNRPAIVLDGNDLAASGLVLEASADGSTIRGLVIRDFGNDGIHILGGSDNHWITGNYLGSLTTAGTNAGTGEANAGSGIYVASGSAGTWVGGSGAGQGNVLSGNLGDGLDSYGTGMVVQGNLIGTDASSTLAIGNGQDGISLAGSNNRIGGTGAGEGNVIAYNSRVGIDPWTAATGNALLGNRIFGNAGLGIDLALDGVTANDAGDADTGSNNLQNFPVLAAAGTDGSRLAIAGTINSTANTTLRLEFFANATGDASGYGEGQTYLGHATVFTDGNGNASFVAAFDQVVPVGQAISATATVMLAGGTFGSTSEFSLNVTTTGALIVDTTADTVDGTTTSVANLVASKGADGRISLREAIIATNNTAGQDTIFLPAGSYALTRTGSGENLASTGDLDILQSLTLIGAGASSTIVTATGLGDRVFEIAGTGTSAYLSGITVTGGSGSSGGGILENSSTTLTLWDSVIANNSTTGTTGGGLYTSGTTFLNNVTVSGNSGASGAGIYSNSTLVISNSTIAANTGSNQGAGIWSSGTSANLTLINTTISGNSNSGQGGGAYIGKTASLVNATIAGNTASTGGGIYRAAGSVTVNLLNTIVAGNTGTSATPNPDISGAIVSQGTNIIGDTTGNSGWVASDQQNVNPLLNALAGNGGATQTMSLQAASPAIDAGTSNAAPVIDQRGYGRDGSVDIGAYEFNATSSSGSPPVNTVPGARTVNEDTGLAIAGVSVSDIDGNLASVSLSAVHGALTVSLGGGATLASGANGSSWLSLTGTQTQINAALASLSYQGSANYNGGDVLTVTSTDSSGQIDSDTVAITVSSVNDAPAGTDKTLTVAEDAVYAFTVADFGFTDPTATACCASGSTACRRAAACCGTAPPSRPATGSLRPTSPPAC